MILVESFLPPAAVINKDIIKYVIYRHNTKDPKYLFILLAKNKYKLKKESTPTYFGIRRFDFVEAIEIFA